MIENRTSNASGENMSIEDKMNRQLLQKNAAPMSIDLSRKEIRKAKREGIHDGKRSLVRTDEDGNTISASIDKNVNALLVENENAWAEHHNIILPYLTELREDITILKTLEKVKAEAEKELENFVESNKDTLSSRKRGEEKLSDEAVIKRRVRELNRAKQVYEARVNQASKELSAAVKQIHALRSYLCEANSNLRIITDKTMYLTKLKIDYYWKGVLKKHPKKDSLPLVPKVEIQPKGEIAFFAQHVGVLTDADEVLKKYGVIYEEEG